MKILKLIGFILIIAFVLLLIVLAMWDFIKAVYYMTPEDFEPRPTCNDQCNSLGYTYYKIDNKGLRWENCWCFDEEHKPISTGNIKW